jgi:hypothetical protein
MSDTPNDRAGHLTEFVMKRIRTQSEARGVARLDDGQYNKVYESVYEVLYREMVLGKPGDSDR